MPWLTSLMASFMLAVSNCENVPKVIAHFTLRKTFTWCISTQVEVIWKIYNSQTSKLPFIDFWETGRIPTFIRKFLVHFLRTITSASHHFYCNFNRFLIYSMILPNFHVAKCTNHHSNFLVLIQEAGHFGLESQIVFQQSMIRPPGPRWRLSR